MWRFGRTRSCSPAAPDGSTFPRPDGVTQRYDRLAAALGIETTFHKLRHYSATELIAAGSTCGRSPVGSATPAAGRPRFGPTRRGCPRPTSVPRRVSVPVCPSAPTLGAGRSRAGAGLSAGGERAAATDRRRRAARWRGAAIGEAVGHRVRGVGRTAHRVLASCGRGVRSRWSTAAADRPVTPSTARASVEPRLPPPVSPPSRRRSTAVPEPVDRVLVRWCSAVPTATGTRLEWWLRASPTRRRSARTWSASPASRFPSERTTERAGSATSSCEVSEPGSTEPAVTLRW